MDAQLMARLHRVAAAGGPVIVAAAATANWPAVKARFVAVLGHGHRGREEVQGELLEETNQAIAHAPAGLLDQITHDQEGRAQQLLLQAMLVDPSVSDDLEKLLAELNPPPEEDDEPDPPPPANRPTVLRPRILGAPWT
ncbi:hypothetical protein [Cryptosporangium aurantiacum]|uniref:Uncharacterized protein n=1 Tax=Cryptosporangium aurantiacum TaxID=134849 RepID=A0A1M7RL60_9ACTN|nr:hypothetical protein [Cryptosporangium aurantiacum]SHN46902.1 hypothetical protein SAMN05443668_118135 [Cryptosporangium aurantiacum]